MNFENRTEQRDKLILLLKNVREENNLTQVVLAKKLGTPQSFISKYESGTRRLDILELRQICNAMGISMKDFMKRLEENINEGA